MVAAARAVMSIATIDEIASPTPGVIDSTSIPECRGGPNASPIRSGSGVDSSTITGSGAMNNRVPPFSGHAQTGDMTSLMGWQMPQVNAVVVSLENPIV